MKYMVSFATVAVVMSFAIAASLPASPGSRGNAIVLEVAPKGTPSDRREGKTDPEDQDAEPFEIVVPIARNFSSLEELFQILREDADKEPRVATGTPATYVKGTERNASDYLIFFTDGSGKSG